MKGHLNLLFFVVMYRYRSLIWTRENLEWGCKDQHLRWRRNWWATATALWYIMTQCIACHWFLEFFTLSGQGNPRLVYIDVSLRKENNSACNPLTLISLGMNKLITGKSFYDYLLWHLFSPPIQQYEAPDWRMLVQQMKRRMETEQRFKRTGSSVRSDRSSWQRAVVV